MKRQVCLKSLILPRPGLSVYMVGHESGKCRSALNSARSCWGPVPAPALSQLEAFRASVLPALEQNNPLSWDWVAVNCSALEQGTFNLIQSPKGWAPDYAKMVWANAWCCWGGSDILCLSYPKSSSCPDWNIHQITQPAEPAASPCKPFCKASGNPVHIEIPLL